jgi:chromosomal replication initiator protein
MPRQENGASRVQMDATHLWQTVLGDLQGRVSATAFDNWLRQTSLVGFADDVATVAAPNTYGAATLETRYGDQIRRALSTVVGRPVEVEFRVLATAVTRAAENDDDPVATLFQEKPRLRPEPERPATKAASTRAKSTTERSTPPKSAARQIGLSPTPTHGLNPRYVYETYVVGSGNRFAHAASLSVAEHPGGKYNPFFVYGGVGLGKTHLLHAIGHRALELEPELTISYVSSEKFTNDLISAIRAQRMEEFRGRYREIDILMIDDIQFIAGKESTQEEFFHTFNALYQSGKQVIITSDRPPKSISSLEDRLRSRFEGGLIADVQLPDYEMRIAILRAKGEELGMAIPSDVIELIAQKDRTNIRELEGGLNKIIARAQITDQRISLALAMEALTDAAIGVGRANVTRADIVDAVLQHYKVELRDLRGKSRSKDIALPRQVAMYLLREETDSSLVEIGQELGDRDHTTILHGVRKIEEAMTTDSGLRSQLFAIRQAIFQSSAES